MVVGQRAHEVTAEFDSTWWHGAVDDAAWCALAAPDLSELMVGGERVAKGAVVAIVEAMKMENQVLAPFAGVVREVRCRQQESVIANQVLVVIGRDETVEAG